jgi:hypothetical protein
VRSSTSTIMTALAILMYSNLLVRPLRTWHSWSSTHSCSKRFLAFPTSLSTLLLWRALKWAKSSDGTYGHSGKSRINCQISASKKPSKHLKASKPWSSTHG